MRLEANVSICAKAGDVKHFLISIFLESLQRKYEEPERGTELCAGQQVLLSHLASGASRRRREREFSGPPQAPPAPLRRDMVIVPSGRLDASGGLGRRGSRVLQLLRQTCILYLRRSTAVRDPREFSQIRLVCPIPSRWVWV